jgi:hypothetical protein
MAAAWRKEEMVSGTVNQERTGQLEMKDDTGLTATRAWRRAA